MRIQALIFDFDGTILDTETPEYEAWRTIYQEHGVELPLDGWAASIGRGIGDNPFDPYHTLERLTGRPIDQNEVRFRKRELFSRRLALLGARPGVEDYLRGAKELGLKVGLASSSHHDWVDSRLEKLGLLDYFDAILCADDVTRTKPDPELYAAALYRLGEIPPAAGIAVEDSPNGVKAAKAAGLFCVATPNSLTALLPLDHADLVVPSLAELPLPDLLRRAESGAA
jgi:HAD superfamily hydrolase (TIGR01509 family)